MTGARNFELCAWTCLSAALIALRVYPDFIPNLGNDAFQYLSMAENALAGQFGYTSIVHYDAERSFGVIPAPVVTFPGGFPLAIALVSLSGLTIQTAALLICAVSIVACVPLIAFTAYELGVSRLLRNAIIAAYVGNSTIIDYGASAFSEPPFTFIVMLGTALLVAARHHATGGGWRWAAAGLVFGLGYCIRYAGLFFVVGMAALAVRHLFSANRRAAKGYALAFIFACVPVIAGMARNIALVGNWRGGPDKVVSNALWSVLLQTYGAANNLLFGHLAGHGFLVLRSLCAVLIIAGMAGLALSYVRQRKAQGYVGPPLDGIVFDLGLLAVVYSACMFYAGLTTVITYNARMFVPLVPLAFVLGGLAVHTMLMPAPRGRRLRTISSIVLTTGFCIYLVLNLLIYQLPPPAAPSLTKIVDLTSGGGKSARAVVQDLVGQHGVIVATNGQAFGHILRRPVVSLVGPYISTIEWNDETIRDTVRRFHATAIIIYVPIREEWNSVDFVPSQFVRQLVQGDAPSWMKLVYRSSQLLIYAPRD